MIQEGLMNKLINKIPKATNVFLIQTAHKVGDIKKSTEQSIADCLLPNTTGHMQPSLHWADNGEVKHCEVKFWSPSYDFWKTNSKRGNWDVSSTCSSSRVPEQILEERVGLSGDSCQQDTGAMCIGWHMVLGIMQRYADGLEPGTVHSTAGPGLSYW